MQTRVGGGDIAPGGAEQILGRWAALADPSTIAPLYGAFAVAERGTHLVAVYYPHWDLYDRREVYGLGASTLDTPTAVAAPLQGGILVH